MNYEQKYKNLIEAIKEMMEANPHDEGLQNWVQDNVPELTESEDERIRKALIRFHKGTIDIDGIKGDEIVYWLEKQVEPVDKGEISDGFHTFNELYYYRMLYNAAFFNMLPKEWVHKSKKHNDGEECFGGGWFIVMANLPTGQIRNHYELKDWDLFQIPEKERADKWDGHTPQEAAERLHKYLLENQGEKEISAPNWCHHKVDLSDYSEEYRKAYYDGWNNCNMQHSQCNEERNDVVKCLINGMKFYYEDNEDATWGTDKWSMPVKHIIEVLEKQGESKTSGIWFNTKDTTAPSERDIIGWYKTDGKLESCPMIVWFCSEEEARKEAEENNDCFLAYWAELPEQGFEKKYWFEKQVDKPQGKTALDAINEEIADNANKVEPKDYNSIDPHFAKPADKVEPKFKVGDWIIHHGTENIYQVVAVIDNQYQLRYGDNYTIQKCDDVDRNARLWNISDAKPGDVLYYKSDNNIEYIVMNKGINMHGNIDSYFRYNSLDGFALNVPAVLSAENDNITLATREQRDTLEMAITNAGYRWDKEKLKLEKI